MMILNIIHHYCVFVVETTINFIQLILQARQCNINTYHKQIECIPFVFLCGVFCKWTNTLIIYRSLSVCWTIKIDSASIVEHFLWISREWFVIARNDYWQVYRAIMPFLTWETKTWMWMPLPLIAIRRINIHHVIAIWFILLMVNPYRSGKKFVISNHLPYKANQGGQRRKEV